MNGVTKIKSEQNVMMITFTDADCRTSLSEALQLFAENGVVVDMICQSAPRGASIDFSFTTNTDYFETAMKTIKAYQAAAGAAVPLISSGYSKINLFGEEMVTSCGVAARALTALADAQIDVALITTSDLDISLLVREENEDMALAALCSAFAI